MREITGRDIQAAMEQSAVGVLPTTVCDRLAIYATLLEQWNSKFNLTSLRDPQALLDRHFVECVAASQAVPQGPAALLDYGTGAGLPGIVIAICRPDLNVTLAEAHSKKVAFLREVLRAISASAVIFHGRVSSMAVDAKFEIITLRAVERMPQAMAEAAGRIRVGGYLAIFCGPRSYVEVSRAAIEAGMTEVREVELPVAGKLIFFQRRLA